MTTKKELNEMYYYVSHRCSRCKKYDECLVEINYEKWKLRNKGYSNYVSLKELQLCYKEESKYF